MNYYNEFDNFAADWLENLIAAGLIPPGKVDRRSIKEVQPDDLEGFTQCHFFAGIGGWSEALRLAAVPSTVSLWTGSCPCQGYSIAGRNKGNDDPRNLWPDFFRLIRERQPELVFGEQVENAIQQHGWLDGIFTDLEGEAYTCGASVLGAHSVGKPHIRQRLYWVAHTGPSPSWNYGIGQGSQAGAGEAGEPQEGIASEHGRRGRHRDGVADTGGTASERNARAIPGTQTQVDSQWKLDGSVPDRLTDGGDDRDGVEHAAGIRRDERRAKSIWRGVISGCGESLAHCRDGKSRRFESGSFPLAHGIPKGMGRGKPELAGMAKRARSNRVGRLKGYGNAIVPAVAAEFIAAFFDVHEDVA